METSLYKDKFQLGTDYKATFAEEVEELTKQELTVEFKNRIIHLLIESYVEQTDEIPDSYQLTRLATWLIQDTTNDPDKVAKTEYPILSKSQEKLRRRREMSHYKVENLTISGYRINGKRKPKGFMVFGQYEGGS